MTSSMPFRSAGWPTRPRPWVAEHDVQVQFESLHGVLVLAALAWLLGRTGWSESRRTRLLAVAIGAALTASLTG